MEKKIEAAIDLSRFDNSWYRPGSLFKRTLWYFCNEIFLHTSLPYPSSLKRYLLRLFGARMGRNVVIKPNVRIKFPWLLQVGDNVWIGESVWIDNLCQIIIGNNVCLSQEAYLLTGNHDFKSKAFDLIVKPIAIEDGVWVGARAIVCPGVTLKSHSIITVGSVIQQDTEPYTIYRGNPAVTVRKREITR